MGIGLALAFPPLFVGGPSFFVGPGNPAIQKQSWEPEAFEPFWLPEAEKYQRKGKGAVLRKCLQGFPICSMFWFGCILYRYIWTPEDDPPPLE